MQIKREICGTPTKECLRLSLKIYAFIREDYFSDNK